MRNGARTRGQRFRNRSKLPAVGGRGGAACDRESSSLNAPTEPEPTISYEGGGWSHASLATTPNRTVWTAGLQKLFHLAEDTSTVRPRPPGWEPNRGAGESILIQARGSKAYVKGRRRVPGDPRRQRLRVRARRQGGGEEGAVGGFGGVGFFTTEGFSREVAPFVLPSEGATSVEVEGTAVEAAAEEGSVAAEEGAAEAGAAEALAPSDSRSGVDRPTTPSSPEVSAAKAATAEQSC